MGGKLRPFLSQCSEIFGIKQEVLYYPGTELCLAVASLQ